MLIQDGVLSCTFMPIVHTWHLDSTNLYLQGSSHHFGGRYSVLPKPAASVAKVPRAAVT